jgi:hypothetical protein
VGSACLPTILSPAMKPLERTNPAFHDPVKAFRMTKFQNVAAQ